LLALINIGLSACAGKSEVLKLWPKDLAAQKTGRCYSKLSLHIEAPKETIRVDAAMDFTLDAKKSQMKLIFYSALLTPIAKIEIDGKGGTWTDENGTERLENRPLFKKWFSRDWWKEIAFTFGMVPREARAFVWMNEDGKPALYRKGNRQIRCQFDGDTSQPKSCQIKDIDLEGSLDFSSVDCQSSL
jgi:hypothetical protein